jgi:hypothetical protein
MCDLMCDLLSLTPTSHCLQEKKHEAIDYEPAPSSNVHEFPEGERRFEWGEEMLTKC